MGEGRRHKGVPAEQVSFPRAIATLQGSQVTLSSNCIQTFCPNLASGGKAQATVKSWLASSSLESKAHAARWHPASSQLATRGPRPAHTC